MHVAQFGAKHSASGRAMQVAYACRMGKDRPYRENRRLWLAEVVKDLGGPAKAAAHLESVDTYLTALINGNRGVGDELAGRIEKLKGLAVGAVDQAPPKASGAGEAAPWPFSDVLTEQVRELSGAERAGIERLVSAALDFRRSALDGIGSTAIRQKNESPLEAVGYPESNNNEIVRRRALADQFGEVGDGRTQDQRASPREGKGRS
jgi:hypothetical protein